MRWLKRLTVLAISSALAILCLEAWIRLTDAYGISYFRDVPRYSRRAIEYPVDGIRPDGRLFQQLPDLDLEFEHFAFRTDSLGTRSRIAGAPVPERGEERVEGDPAWSKLRILFLGDSVTLGWGVDDEDTWIRVLEREGRAADGRALECFNAGHLKYDTVQMADLLATWGPVLRPDVVAMTFNSNDLVSTLDHYLESRQAGGGPQPSGLEKLQRKLGEHFRGIRDAQRYLHERQLLGNPENITFDGLDNLPSYPEGWPRCEGALDQALAKSRELGAEFVLLDHGGPRVPEVRTWAEARGVPWVDIAFTREEFQSDIRNSPADPHANPKGNRLIAEKALRGLAAAGVLAPQVIR